MKNQNVPLTYLGWVVAVTGLSIVSMAIVFPQRAGMVLFLSPDHAVTDINQAGMHIILALSAVFGGTMIGWGLTIVYVAYHFTRSARNGLAIGVMAWFVADSLGSLVNHLGYNVILNVAFLIAALLALFLPRTRGQS